MLTFVAGFQELPRWLFGGKRLFFRYSFLSSSGFFAVSKIGFFVWKFRIERDAGRLIDCRARTKFSPLGDCALAVTGLPIDRIDAVSDQDFPLEFLSANAIIAMHLSRLGSNIMPQKKNPDPMELVRGKSGRVIGGLVTLLIVCKGLPHAYNRDLQEDEEPVFDSVRAILGMLEVLAEFAMNITFNRERIQKSLPVGFPGVASAKKQPAGLK
ncbi:hypothetical protein KIW84_073779 [Lathyrus oleraceus]|uniref:Fumarate lyase N-terminal domain-containing protein n=1 Tax=Pisum sativum TaxID=3888 RepID=A0A9D4VRY4_PEA|nr:hypothetical protein KIW84_073779 [Pisum sativum]